MMRMADRIVSWTGLKVATINDPVSHKGLTDHLACCAVGGITRGRIRVGFRCSTNARILVSGLPGDQIMGRPTAEMVTASATLKVIEARGAQGDVVSRPAKDEVLIAPAANDVIARPSMNFVRPRASRDHVITSRSNNRIVFG